MVVDILICSLMWQCYASVAATRRVTCVPNCGRHGLGKHTKILSPRSTKKVRFEPGSARFKDFQPCSNLEPDLWSGSTFHPNLGPNFGPVLKSSGLNFGSEPNCSIPTSSCPETQLEHICSWVQNCDDGAQILLDHIWHLCPGYCSPPATYFWWIIGMQYL